MIFCRFSEVHYRVNRFAYLSHGTMVTRCIADEARLEAKSHRSEHEANIQCKDDVRLLHGHTGRPALLQEPTKASTPNMNCPDLFGILQFLVLLTYGCPQMPSSIVRRALWFLTTRMRPKADPPAVLPRLQGYDEDSKFSTHITMQNEMDCVVLQNQLGMPQDFVLWDPMHVWHLGTGRQVCAASILLYSCCRFPGQSGNFGTCQCLVAVIAQIIGCVGC